MSDRLDDRVGVRRTMGRAVGGGLGRRKEMSDRLDDRVGVRRTMGRAVGGGLGRREDK
jgi:hypothetical protein